jgi:FAD/FMN-containing dehydrogenase
LPTAVLALAAACTAASAPAARTEPSPACRCTPGDPCWPTRAEWQAFGAKLHGRLEQPQSPLAPCRTDASGAACAAALKDARNPFFLQDQAAGTESTGWLGAWTSASSAYAVVAQDAADVAAAVELARRRRVRLVVKGTGHDYLGRSSAPDSLLVWTHAMRDVSVHDAFLPQGCTGAQSAPAVSLGAGTRWLEAYQEVTVRHRRYVQGGGCTSVGAAGGFLQGGGFGSWSKKFGIAAASLLEAEIVTADGAIRIANECQNQDLFWALRGGGGGTYGIVTRVTLRTHPLPSWFGVASGTIAAKGEAAFEALLEKLLLFYRESLSNESWGEQIRVRRDASIEVGMVFQGMRASEAEKAWQPLREWVSGHPDLYTMKMRFIELPGERMWDYSFLKDAPGAVEKDARPDAPSDRFWWTDDAEQVSMYWYAYQSRWIPLALFEGENAKRLAKALLQASRHWSVGLHFNKGQAGAAAEAVERGRLTSMNPAVFDAAALVIVAAGTRAFPGIAGHEPDKAAGDAARRKVAAAMDAIRAIAPDSGTYVNESDWFEPQWQQTFWGANYQRLLGIKQKYDPDGLFYCHHCVGSEGWSEGGACRLAARVSP